MNDQPAHEAKSKRQGYVAAMFLSTALSALGAGGAAAESAMPVRAITDLSRYCTACWRNARLHPDCWTDCTQEVFSRLLERVAPETWDRLLEDEGAERREFLRAIDTVKKRTQRARTFSSHPIETVADERQPVNHRRADDLDAVRQAAAEVLSQRQRRIIQLSLEGWSVHEMAAKLRLPPERISDEKYKAIRKLRDYLGALSALSPGA